MAAAAASRAQPTPTSPAPATCCRTLHSIKLTTAAVAELNETECAGRGVAGVGGVPGVAAAERKLGSGFVAGVRSPLMPGDERAGTSWQRATAREG